MSADHPTLDDLFRRPSEQPPPQALPPPASTQPGAAWTRQNLEQARRTYLQNRDLYGGMDTRRQREARERAAEIRAAEAAAALQETQRQIELNVSPPPGRPEFLIDWYNTTHWATPEYTYSIAEMPDQFLWTTILWLVRNVHGLYLQYEQLPDTTVLALASRRWLALQPAFRALLQESLRRQLSFPPDIATYIRQYLLDKNDELANYEPWRDPAVLEAQRELQSFTKQPLHVDNHYGKRPRSIEL